MARKRRPEEHENHERWLVSYADFITLLFAFFVVLYATSNRNEEKEKQFEESIRKFMKIFAVAFNNNGGGNQGNNPGSIIEPLEHVRDEARDNKQIAERLEKMISNSMNKTEKEEYIPDIKAEQNGVRIVLSASAVFPIGSAKIRTPAVKALSTVANILKQTPYRLSIEGHTDNQPVAGGQYETNWELAGARASSVVRFLAKVHHVNPKKMSAVSFADQHPLADNETEGGQAKNRRIEIFISTKDEAEE